MSKGPDGAATGRAREPEIPREEFVNRKLIRPAMLAGNGGAAAQPALERPHKERREKRGAILTPETTHAEAYYFQKQIAARTRMSVKLKNGEEIVGIISWYDRHCIKVERSGKPDLLLYKQGIRFMHKME